MSMLFSTVIIAFLWADSDDRTLSRRRVNERTPGGHAHV
jgi:hypothetical protein